MLKQRTFVWSEPLPRLISDPGNLGEYSVALLKLGYKFNLFKLVRDEIVTLGRNYDGSISKIQTNFYYTISSQYGAYNIGEVHVIFA